MKFTLEQLNSLKEELYVARWKLEQIPSGKNVLEFKNSAGQTFTDIIVSEIESATNKEISDKVENELENNENIKNAFRNLISTFSEKFYTGIVVKFDGKYYECMNNGTKYEQEPIDETTFTHIKLLSDFCVDLNKLRFLPVDEMRCAIDIDDDYFDTIDKILSDFSVESNDGFVAN